MLWKRWATALLAIPVLIFIIFKGGRLLFAVLVVIASVFGLWEYFRIVYRKYAHPVSPALKALGYCTGAMIVSATYFQLFSVIIILMAINLMGAGLIAILRFEKCSAEPAMAAEQVLGITYIPVLLMFMVLVYNGPDGPLWVFFLFWVIGWGDTGALYVGSYIGRRKLCPAVSPKKTIEGAVGGLATSLLAAWIFKLLFFNELPFFYCTVFALATAISGQIGDLFESLFKRASGVKDSGNLLPGHGGLLDRIDALLFAAPIAYLLKEHLLL